MIKFRKKIIVYRGYEEFNCTSWGFVYASWEGELLDVRVFAGVLSLFAVEFMIMIRVVDKSAAISQRL